MPICSDCLWSHTTPYAPSGYDSRLIKKKQGEYEPPVKSETQEADEKRARKEQGRNERKLAGELAARERASERAARKQERELAAQEKATRKQERENRKRENEQYEREASATARALQDRWARERREAGERSMEEARLQRRLEYERKHDEEEEEKRKHKRDKKK